MTTIFLPDATVDLDSRQVLRADGGSAALTEQEAALLGHLVEHAGEVVPRDTLLAHVLGYSPRVLTRAVDHAIARLRAKIEADPASPRALLTVHGVGYRLTMSPAPMAPPQQVPARQIAYGAVRVDLDGRLALRDGLAIPLTEAEVALLVALDAAGGRAVERSDLARKVRGRGDARALDHLVHRLRAKLEPRPDEPVWLLTERGRGYRLASAPAAPRRQRAADVFVGRAAELRAIRDALARARMVTLVGPGGVGKSRLALEAADTLVETFPGGIWHADLGDAREPLEVCAAVARALGVPLTAAEPLGPIGAALANRGLALLILDDAEAAADALPPTLGAWLAEAPDLHVLATSRHVLRLRGEHILPVPPLDLAADGSSSAAEALFVARARAARAGFDDGPDQAAAIGEIVRRLDGIPLAIELAAARVRVMSPAEVLARLDRPLDLLASRQVTMRGAIEASWRLLSPDEQQAHARLAVFRGGFSLEAAEAVLAGGRFPADLLRALVDHSLVVVESAGSGTRYRLYDPIREHAREKLDASDRAPDAELAHGRWYGRLGADAVIEALHAHGGLERRSAMRLDLGNVLLALERAILRGDGEIAGACGVAAAELAVPLGRAKEIEAVLLRALPLLHGSPWHPRALRWLGLVASQLGRADEAERRWVEALAAFADDTSEAALLTRVYVASRLRRRAADEARAAYADLLVVMRQLGAARVEAIVLGNLAILDHDTSRHDAARDGYARAAAMLADIGDLRQEAMTVSNLALLHENQGRRELAREGLERATTMYGRLGERRSEGRIRMNLGEIARTEGRLEEAEEALLRALAYAREVGDRALEGMALSSLAQVRNGQGRHDEALAGYERAIGMLEGLGAARAAAVCVVHRALLHRSQGRLDDAQKGFDAAVGTLDPVDPRAAAYARAGRAGLRLSRGDREGAREDLEEAARTAETVASTHLTAFVAAERARLCAAEGRTEDAHALLIEVEAIVRKDGAEPGSDLGKLATTLRRDLA